MSFTAHLTCVCVCVCVCCQAHGAAELSTYCEGFFLQHMPGLMEREAFRGLLLLGPGGRWGSGRETPLDEMEAMLARRLRSLYVTSRV